jgi:aminopeptidase N
VGPDAETETWTDYGTELDGILARSDRIAWPGPFADAGALRDFLFSRAPYIKGAHFYRAVAERIGADELDRVLALFFSLHVGEAAGMQDLLDLIVAETGFDPGPLADGWLRSLGRPAP